MIDAPHSGVIESTDPSNSGVAAPANTNHHEKAVQMLLTPICANAKAIHAVAAARPRVSAHVAFTFVMPSYGTLLGKGNSKDGAGLRGVRSSG